MSEDLELSVSDISAVPEPLRGFYEKHDDGEYRLKVKGLEDTNGLKSALEKERTSRKELERKVKRWEALGKSDEEIAELISSHESLEQERMRKEGDFDKLLKQKEEAWLKRHEAMERELNAVRASEREAIINTQLIAALNRAGATAEGAELLPDRLTSRIKLDIQNGKRTVTILSADGETPLAGSGTNEFATFDDLVAEAMAKYPSLFKGDGKSGSGMRPNAQSGGTGASIRSKSDLKSERDRAAFVEKNGLDAYRSLPA